MNDLGSESQILFTLELADWADSYIRLGFSLVSFGKTKKLEYIFSHKGENPIVQELKVIRDSRNQVIFFGIKIL
jgi:hypothetical protein